MRKSTCLGIQTASALGASILLSVAIGCGDQSSKAPATTGGGKAESHAHAEHEAAPHGGHLIELGEEEFHAELVDDDRAGTVTIYLLGSDAKTPVAGDDQQVVLNLVVESQPKQFTLKNAAGEKRDQFVAQDPELMKALDASKATGKLNVKIKGKSYVGEVNHSADDHKH